jgi:hypothetical protein
MVVVPLPRDLGWAGSPGGIAPFMGGSYRPPGGGCRVSAGVRAVVVPLHMWVGD